MALNMEKLCTSSSSTCCSFISATVCVGLRVKSLLTGWCFLMWRWSEAKGWSGNGNVQLGNDLSQASGPRGLVGNSRLTLLSADATQERCSQTLLLTRHLPCRALQQW